MSYSFISVNVGKAENDREGERRERENLFPFSLSCSATKDPMIHNERSEIPLEK